MIVPRGTPLSFIDTTKPSRPMDNSRGYTHETPAVVERKVLAVSYRDGVEMTEVIHIQPNVRKAIK
jgi:hypothetical protein